MANACEISSHGASVSAPTARNCKRFLSQRAVKQGLSDKCKATAIWTVGNYANINKRLSVTAPFAGFVDETDTSSDLFTFIKAGEFSLNGVSTRRSGAGSRCSLT